MMIFSACSLTLLSFHILISIQIKTDYEEIHTIEHHRGRIRTQRD